MFPKFLYHYFEKEQGPFKNITSNGLKEARKIQKNISKGFNSNRPANYIDLRFDLERRLRIGFEAKGGRPNRNDPFYFTLGACNWIETCYQNPGFVKIPIEEIKSEHISFTYPDSMVSFQFYDEPKLEIYRKNSNGKVFLISEINEVIEEHGLPNEEKWLGIEEYKYDRYIEAQVWDDHFLSYFDNSNL